RWGNVERRLPGDPAAGTADPRRSSQAGHQDTPGGGRLPGEATAPRRRREDREVGDGREDGHHDEEDGRPGQENGTDGTGRATAPQDRARMLPLWQPGPPPARLPPAPDPSPASTRPE
ncbi:Patched domain-containing protein, partial [Trichinella spiralis]